MYVHETKITVYTYLAYSLIMTGFTKNHLNVIFCISRNTNLK